MDGEEAGTDGAAHQDNNNNQDQLAKPGLNLNAAGITALADTLKKSITQNQGPSNEKHGTTNTRSQNKPPSAPTMTSSPTDTGASHDVIEDDDDPMEAGNLSGQSRKLSLIHI